MNEIIKRLAEQAVEESKLPAAFWWVTQDPKMARVAERFAELIVEECATVMNDNDFEGSSIGNVILNHFGIKE